jgi:hypothetical protein
MASISPPMVVMRTLRKLASSVFFSRKSSPTRFEPLLRSARSVSTCVSSCRRCSSSVNASCQGAVVSLSFSMASASAARFSRIHLISSMMVSSARQQPFQ